MKKLFLQNVKKGFATNSSSYHSMLILTDEEYERWRNGEVINGWEYNEWFELDEFENDWSNTEFDEKTYTTAGGETIYIFCRYGSDY